ncbi:hypothetical protein I6F37_39230, partial [Bradyrhizobium sp. NBAIM08]|nr:hypothetical protein [Bradyrhizobium sp. NBAIM08]
MRFASAVQRLLAEGYDTLLTVEPGTALRSLTMSVVRAHPARTDVSVLSTLDPGAGGDAALLRTVGRLWERGVAIARPAEQPPRRRQPVPTYPFQRTRHWLPDPDAGRPLADRRQVSALLHEMVWCQCPLPAGEVLASVGLVGSHPT